MRFTPDLLDEIRTRLPVSQVVARRVKLKRRGREFVGLSPFKFEKTPSFTVNDQKGFYHCFASGEHGDIFTFVMKTEGLDFPEAVERLAGEAGVTLAEASPRDAEMTQTRSRLHEVLAAAASFFERQLAEKAGAPARGYLLRREVSDESRALFRLGYAPNDRSALKSALGAAGFTHDEMVQAGLLIAGDDIPVAYDRFRDRIIFPITDLKGRVIAFGGRALDPDQPAKYLNSPETPLFHKGGILFNAAQARQAAYDAGTVIVTEGYMDVIALSGAGLANTVAPLGTALTESQLRLLWRMAPEPILCFDGDAAGQKAAYRAVDTALPLLKPGFGLRFAFLPKGQDPDDLIRFEGKDAFSGILSNARQLADVIVMREAGSDLWDTPEKRSSLYERIKGQINRIQDRTLRDAYWGDLKEDLQKIQKQRSYLQTRGFLPGAEPSNSNSEPNTRRRDNQRWSWREKVRRPPIAKMQLREAPTDSLFTSKFLSKSGPTLVPREALLVQTMLTHPWLIADYAEEIAELDFKSPALTALRNAILEIQTMQNSLDRDQLRTQLSHKGQESVLGQVKRAITHRSNRFAQPAALREEVEAGWRHLLALQNRFVALNKEFEAAACAYHHDQTEENLSYINQLHSEIHALEGVGRTSETPVDSDKKFEETIEAAKQSITERKRGHRKHGDS